jgi:HK97 family phage major capsid protein
MKNVTVEQLQRNLQALANQKGAKGFEQAKALYMDGIMVTDAEGNPVDPADLDVKVMKPTVNAADQTEPEDDDDDDKSAKSIADEVRDAVRTEIAKSIRPVERKAPVVTGVRVHGRLRAFKSADEAYKFGRWAMGCMGHSKSAQFCADHGIAITKGHIEGSNTAGGFLVPDEFENSLITLRDQFGAFRANARIIPMSSDVKRMPRRNGTVTAYFVGEASAGTQSQQNFDSVNLVAKKLMVLSKISSELNEDNVVAIGDDLANEISYAFARKEDECGFEGDGTSNFGGILGLKNAIGAGGTADTTSVTDILNLTLGDLRAVVGRLAAWADGPNAKWYMRRSVWNNAFMRLAESANGAMMGEILAGDAQTPRFMGYDVVLSEAIVAPTANAGQTYCYFGDLSLAAYLGDRRTTTVEFSNSALNAFEQDELVVRGTERFDINVANVGDATVAGAMIKATL